MSPIYKIDVDIEGTVVHETVRATLIRAPSPDGKGQSLSYRWFRPGKKVLEHLMQRLVALAGAGDSPARVKIASIRGFEHVPESTRRELTEEGLRATGFLESAGVRTAVELMESWVQKELSRASPDALEDELMRALVGTDCRGAASRRDEVGKARKVVLQGGIEKDARMYGRVRAAVAEGKARYTSEKLATPERTGRHAIRQYISRKITNDPVTLALLSLRLGGAMESVVDDANRRVLAALIEQCSLSPAEVRAFRFYRLRRRHPSRETSGDWFQGIVSEQPFFASLLRLSPETCRQLAYTVFFRAWPDPQQHSRAQDALRTRLVALLRAGQELLAETRDAEKRKKQVKADNRRQYTGASTTSTPEAHFQKLLLKKRRLTPKQRRLVDLLDEEGFDIDAAARILHITPRAVRLLLQRAAKALET